MLKRKLSYELNCSPHVSDDPTHGRHRKRLFRIKNNKHLIKTPVAGRDMNELLDFVLQHEEAFQK